LTRRCVASYRERTREDGMGKMTTEELEKFLEVVGNELGVVYAGKLRAHIAALEALSAVTCIHTEAVFGCRACVARVRARYSEFPLQVTRDAVTKPGPQSVPWAVAEKAWAAYAQQYGTWQSVERLAERGGFGWCEMDTFYPGWREEVDPFRRLERECSRLAAELLTVRDAHLKTLAERDEWKTDAQSERAHRERQVAEAHEQRTRLLEGQAVLTAELEAERRSRVSISEIATKNANHWADWEQRARALESERDALRERVEALEDMTKTQSGERHEEWQRRVAAESTLAAIRQRAVDAETGAIMGGAGTWDDDIHADVVARGAEGMLRDAARGVARYILGEDGAEAVPSCPRCAKPMPFDQAHLCLPAAPEPTTAEAFATVRAVLSPLTSQGPHVRHPEGVAALSLLERHMGALWRTFVEEMAHWPTCPSGNDFSDAGWARCDCHMGQVRTILTDAPPVFTLEEVERLAAEHCSAGDASRLVRALAALRSTGGGQWAPVG
jgi:hypothetical protein